MAQFGDLLAELRQDRGLTQSELGKVISVTSGTISNYEHGFHLPDLEKLVLLADYFGVSTDYLLGRISSDVLRSMTTLFYLSNEGISIFENIGKIGIPLPGKLNNLLSRFEDIKNQMK